MPPDSNPDQDRRPTIVPKGPRELIGQLTNAIYSKEAEKVVHDFGYDQQAVRTRLLEMAGLDSEEYDLFLRILRRDIREVNEVVTASFSSFSSEHPAPEDISSRKEELKKRVITPDSQPDPELLKTIRDMFPSGNFLVHGTSVGGALSVAGDSDGQLKSVAEQGKTNEKARGKGGFMGISFSFNGVRALPGTWRHMCMFVTSPELALRDGQQKLVVPYYAASQELQLVGPEYRRDTVTHIDSTLDFFGLKYLLSGKGVIHDISEIEYPYNCEAGN